MLGLLGESKTLILVSISDINLTNVNLISTNPLASSKNASKKNSAVASSQNGIVFIESIEVALLT